MIMSTKVRLVQNTLNLLLKTINNISPLTKPVFEITREYILGSFKVIFQESPLWLRYACLRKQPTFRDATTGFLTKWCLRNKCKNSILMMHHHPDKRSASDWLSQEENLLQPIKSSFQIWVVTSSVWNFCTCSSEVILQGNHSIDCFLRLDIDFVVSFFSFLSLVITVFLL